MDAIYQRIDALTNEVLNGGQTTVTDGEWLIRLEHTYLPWMMAGADRIRRQFRGDEIEVCAISNIRSGNCSENCAFCAQSGHYQTKAPRYDYISSDQLAEQANRARQWGATDFGLVSKGWGIRSTKEIERLEDYLTTLGEQSDIGRCASLGVLTEESASRLKDMGLENYHHNVETSASFFDSICTTHTYQENIDTIRHATSAGLRVCAGGILGMGESPEQRIELASTLRELGVESVPLNFLNPVEGTPLGNRKPMPPLEILQNIAVFRYMLPGAELRIAGGRHFLGDLQAMIFMAGASGIMIGDYLTTKGRRVDDDIKMLNDLKLSVRGGTQQLRAREAACAEA